MTGESSDLSNPDRIKLTDWNKFGELGRALDARKRRMGVHEVGELVMRDGTTPEELDELIEQRQSEEDKEE